MCGFLGALCLCRMFFIPHGIEGAALSAPLFPQARSKLFQNVHHSPVKKGSSPGNTRERPARGLRGTCEGPEPGEERQVFIELREERERERCYGWAGVRSRRGTSPPTMARRSTSWRWRRRRWVSGWIRLPSCGPTTLHTGVTPRECYSGKPSGRFSFLASWRGGHSGIGTCWSSGFREACRAMYCQGRHLAMARTTRQPWQGTSLWNRSRRTSTAKVPSRQSVGQSAKVWALGPEHTCGTGFWFPTTSGQSRSRATRQSATCRLGALPICSKGETILSLPLQRKERTHTSLLFESPRQSLLVPPWPSKRLCGQRRPTSCSGSGVGTTSGLPQRDHEQGHRERDSSASGRRARRRLQVRCATGFPPSFPHAFRKTVISTLARLEHSLQLGRVFDSGGRALDRAIIFCAKSGAVYWERADALCLSCSELPGGGTSQLRKLRSGLFPNKRYPGWTVEHVRRPTLDEATTLVALLESCEAGLGHPRSNVLPRRQRCWHSGGALPRRPQLTTWRCGCGTGSARFAGVKALEALSAHSLSNSL